MDGATPFQRFRYITSALLGPMICLADLSGHRRAATLRHCSQRRRPVPTPPTMCRFSTTGRPERIPARRRVLFLIRAAICCTPATWPGWAMIDAKRNKVTSPLPTTGPSPRGPVVIRCSPRSSPWSRRRCRSSRPRSAIQGTGRAALQSYRAAPPRLGVEQLLEN